MKERKLIHTTFSTLEDRKEEFKTMGGIGQIISLITDATYSNDVIKLIDEQQLTDALNHIREDFAKILGIAQCTDCLEVHKIEHLKRDPSDNTYYCEHCSENYNICKRCGQICNKYCFLCDECAENYSYCEDCGSIYKNEEMQEMICFSGFDFPKRKFSQFTRYTCPNCSNTIVENNNKLFNNVQCRVYIFNEAEDVKFASQENSIKLMLKHKTKNGRPIHYLYSSLISKKENEECLKYFVNYASSKAIQQIVSQDKEIIIELIGQEDFLTIFKGNL